MKKIMAYIVSLTIIDQGIKLIISNILGHKQIDLLSDFLHIHPILNNVSIFMDKGINILFSPAIAIIIPTICIAIVILFYRYLLYISEKWHKLSTLFLCFFMAGILCSIIDQIFWSGSLDYICMYWYSSDLQWIYVTHFYFDLKDIYLNVGGILLIVRGIIYVYEYYKLNKEERKQEKQDTKLLNWIKKGCPLKR